MMRSIARTASKGYSPIAVSPRAMTASVPSRIALATSDASARVGRGWCTMDSSIWVAVITGFAVAIRLADQAFLDRRHFLERSSTPRSPRATITASHASRMRGRSSSAVAFSIFATSFMSGGTSARSSARSSARRTNESPK